MSTGKARITIGTGTDDDTERKIHPVSAVLTYRTYGYPTSLNPTDLGQIIDQIGQLAGRGLPGDSIHRISFEKGILEVEVR